MKLRTALLIAAVPVLLSASGALLACVDLFHSTSFETLCQADASAPECVIDSGVDAGTDTGVDSAVPDTDFCALSRADARTAAEHSCAWVSSCEGPFGHNAFGQCMVDALQAFDCTIRPGRKVIPGSPVHAYWQCLSRAKSCTDVDVCVYPGGVGACAGSGPFNACELNGVTRISCVNPTAAHPSFAENCRGQGRICARSGGTASYCTAGFDDAGSGCSGTVLNDTLEDSGTTYSINQGLDCASYGAGKCAVGAQGPACAATGQACTVSGLGCLAGDGGPSSLAYACFTGAEDTIDCVTLDPTANCQLPSLGPSWDPAEACTATGCTSEQCSGSTIVGCHNGMTFSVDCKKIPGLAHCKMVSNVPQSADINTPGSAPQCAP